jgi:hypothetical protein
MTPARHYFTARPERFVPCAPPPAVVKPLLVQAHCAMSGLIVLLSPAVFGSDKPQAGPRRLNVATVPLRKIYLKRGEIYRGKISRHKIKPTSKKGRYSAPNQ